MTPLSPTEQASSSTNVAVASGEVKKPKESKKRRVTKKGGDFLYPFRVPESNRCVLSVSHVTAYETSHHAVEHRLFLLIGTLWKEGGTLLSPST